MAHSNARAIGFHQSASLPTAAAECVIRLEAKVVASGVVRTLLLAVGDGGCPYNREARQRAVRPAVVIARVAVPRARNEATILNGRAACTFQVARPVRIRVPQQRSIIWKELVESKVQASRLFLAPKLAGLCRGCPSVHYGIAVEIRVIIEARVGRCTKYFGTASLGA